MLSKIANNFKQILNRTGYKMVGWNGRHAFSLYDLNVQIPLTIGAETLDPKGLYLGTSRQFCIDYYSGLSDFEDLLLTYEYNVNDVLAGSPDHTNSEIKVSKAILKKVERFSHEKDS